VPEREEGAVALWAGVVALAVVVLAILTRQVDLFVIFRSIVELVAVTGVFALICAAEARN
jgi:hypothetical protein